MNEFEIGDVVQLKSGGPEMTIDDVPGSGGSRYHCVWFAGNKVQSGYFNREAFILVEEEEDEQS